MLKKQLSSLKLLIVVTEGKERSLQTLTSLAYNWHWSFCLQLTSQIWSHGLTQPQKARELNCTMNPGGTQSEMFDSIHTYHTALR